jgi:hypothetical protein
MISNSQCHLSQIANALTERFQRIRQSKHFRIAGG